MTTDDPYSDVFDPSDPLCDPPTFTEQPVPGRPGVVRPVLNAPIWMGPDGSIHWMGDGHWHKAPPEKIGADGLLHLLKAEPTLLPPAPDDTTAQAIDHRRLHEAHPCLRCGGVANCAFVATTSLGPRWLDLCHPCTHWLRTTAT